MRQIGLCAGTDFPETDAWAEGLGSAASGSAPPLPPRSGTASSPLRSSTAGRCVVRGKRSVVRVGCGAERALGPGASDTPGGAVERAPDVGGGRRPGGGALGSGRGERALVVGAGRRLGGGALGLGGANVPQSWGRGEGPGAGRGRGPAPPAARGGLGSCDSGHCEVAALERVADVGCDACVSSFEETQCVTAVTAVACSLQKLRKLG